MRLNDKSGEGIWDSRAHDWKCVKDFQENWFSLDFDDSDWKGAVKGASTQDQKPPDLLRADFIWGADDIYETYCRLTTGGNTLVISLCIHEISKEANLCVLFMIMTVCFFLQQLVKPIL